MRTTISTIFLTALLLASCSAESDPIDDTTIPSADARITVCGNAPKEGESTRATAPSIPGTCNADMLTIWSFAGKDTHFGIVGNKMTLNTLNRIQDSGEDCADITLDGIDNTNKWTTHQMALSADHNRYAFRALAYTASDAAKFSVNTSAATYPTLLALSLNLPAADTKNERTFSTPELFFGNLGIGGSEKDNETYDNVPSNMLTFSKGGNVSLYGNIYRIVSQLNLKLSKVPSDVKGIELLCSLLPKKIMLSPLYDSENDVATSHGAFYPVQADTSADDCLGSDEWTVVDSRQSPEASTTLSTFLLPSEKGCQLRMRVTYKNATTKTFDIRPEKSVFFNPQNGGYNIIGDAKLKHSDTECYIYSNLTYRFYSYSNVRVNLNADFTNATADTQQISVTIEVEPAFVKKHEFEVK